MSSSTFLLLNLAYASKMDNWKCMEQDYYHQLLNLSMPLTQKKSWRDSIRKSHVRKSASSHHFKTPIITPIHSMRQRKKWGNDQVLNLFFIYEDCNNIKMINKTSINNRVKFISHIRGNNEFMTNIIEEIMVKELQFKDVKFIYR